MASNATPKPATVEVTLPDDSKAMVPLFGPYGDKAIHGTKLVTKVKQSDPKKRKEEDKLHRTYRHSNGIDYWAAQCFVPKDDAEALAMAKAKPANVRDLMEDALCVEAGQASWHENRGGSVTTRVSVNGAPAKRLPNEIITLLRQAGQKVEEVKEEKPTK
jgi:hypothetical protein